MSRHIFVYISVVAILDFCKLACIGVFDLEFFELLIHENLCVDTTMNVLGAFKKSYVQTYIFHVSVAAILDFCTFYCFELKKKNLFKFLIPKNLCVDTRMNILGAFFLKSLWANIDFSCLCGSHIGFIYIVLLWCFFIFMHFIRAFLWQLGAIMDFSDVLAAILNFCSLWLFKSLPWLFP